LKTAFRDGIFNSLRVAGRGTLRFRPIRPLLEFPCRPHGTVPLREVRPMIRFLLAASLAAMMCVTTTVVRSDEPAAPSEKAAGPSDASALENEPVPGFAGKQLQWGQVARVEVIDGVDIENSMAGEKSSKEVQEVAVYRFADKGGTPFAVVADPFAEASDGNTEPAAGLERLKKRGDAWLKLVKDHNAAARVEIRQREKTGSFGIGGMNYKVKLLHHSVLYEPPQEAVQAARRRDRADGTKELQAHLENRARAVQWYTMTNVALGCIAIAILGFVLLPALRSGNAQQP